MIEFAKPFPTDIPQISGYKLKKCANTALDHCILFLCRTIPGKTMVSPTSTGSMLTSDHL